MKNKIKILSDEIHSSLKNNIEENLPKYEHGDFKDILSNGNSFQEIDKEIDFSELLSLNESKPEKKMKSSEWDGKEAIKIFRVFRSIPRNLAMFPRFWVRLCHLELLEYSRNRWITNMKTKEQKIKQIEKHFFCRSRTEIRDDNAISRLWWAAKLVTGLKKNESEKEIEENIRTIFKYAQRRQDIIERDIFKNQRVLEGTINFMKNGGLSRESDTEEFSKSVNRKFSGIFCETLTPNEMDNMLRSY